MCYICHQTGHTVYDCPERHIRLPASPCVHCGGEHWKINCRAPRAVRQEYEAMQRQIEQVAYVDPASIPARLPTHSSGNISGELRAHRASPLSRKGKDVSAHQPRASNMCVICNGEHSARQCPERYTAVPKKPCPNCGGEHWLVNCNNSRQCSHCDSKDHLSRDCPSRGVGSSIAEPEEHDESDGTDTNPASENDLAPEHAYRQLIRNRSKPESTIHTMRRRRTVQRCTLCGGYHSEDQCTSPPLNTVHSEA
jgi:hypothetical protein